MSVLQDVILHHQPTGTAVAINTLKNLPRCRLRLQREGKEKEGECQTIRVYVAEPER